MQDKMSDYTYQILRVAVAQICQTIGWHSIQSTPLELLVDILHKYLQEISRETYRHTELYGRTEPNLVDVGLAFGNLNINLSDIEEYINYVDCVGCRIDVPKYPVRKESNLNFLKPGSKEVLTRPVHIPEYLPPIYPEREENQIEEIKKEITGGIAEAINNVDNLTIQSNSSNNENNIFKKPDMSEGVAAKKPKIVIEEEGRPTREISSVMMTSSGFISPAREGKLPDSKTPIIPEYKSPPPPPPPLALPPPPASSSTLPSAAIPVNNIDGKFEKKDKKKKANVSGEKEQRKKEKSVKENVKHGQVSNGGVTSLVPEKLKAIKKQKNKQKHKEHIKDMLLSEPSLFKPIDPSSPVLRSSEETEQIKNDFTVKGTKQQKADQVKLSSEPSKEKLNIFKKISSSKKDRDETARLPNVLHDTHLLSSIPEGTTITPAPPLKHHHQPPLQQQQQQQPQQQQPQQQQQQNDSQLDDDQVICVDDEPNYPIDVSKHLPPVLHQNLLPPGTTIKAQTTKKPRKKAQQQKQQRQQQHAQEFLERNLPLNLSSEMVISQNPLNMTKKDLIQIPRLLSLSQKPQKEKKERKKTKVKENKKKLLPHSSVQNVLSPQNSHHHQQQQQQKQQQQLKQHQQQKQQQQQLPPQPCFGDSLRDSIFAKNYVNLNQKIGKTESLPNNPPNPYVNPSFPGCQPPIPMFPFYPFPPRPGLIPNPGLFPPLQPMPDNPAFNKFLPMMGFGNFGNMNKTARLTYDEEPLPLPPIDSDKSYCNVAPLVPDSMKFQLSPTRIKPKSSISSSSSLPATQNNDNNLSSTLHSVGGDDGGGGGGGGGGSGGGSGDDETACQNNSNNLSRPPKEFDSPIEISDDENIKSCSEEKDITSSGDYKNNSRHSADLNVINSKTDEQREMADVFEEQQRVRKIEEKEVKLEKRKDKMHKKGKKEKEGKIKKKKDKKDKSKSKEKSDKKKEKDEKKEKEKIRKLKKEKKKDKLRALAYSAEEAAKADNIKPEISQHSTVPKLTLKIGLGNSPQPDSPDGRKLSHKSHNDDVTDNFDDGKVGFDRRESSPELARISPLVTRPPKQKTSSKDKKSDSEDCSSSTATASNIGSSSVTLQQQQQQQQLPLPSRPPPPPPPPVPRGPGRPPKNRAAAATAAAAAAATAAAAAAATATATASSAVASSTDHGHGSSATSSSSSSAANTGSSTYGNSSSGTSSSASVVGLGPISSSAVSSSTSSGATGAGGGSRAGGNANQNIQPTDAEGNQVWICPACGRVDDGTPMIGCDGCDAWYHWVCVGIQVPPDDNEDWYCRVCIAKKQEAHGADRKRKRKKKNKAN